MPFEFPELDIAHLNHRLDLIGRAPQLPASVQYDLASGPLPADALDQASQLFGAPQRQDWGFSTVLENVLAQDPGQISTNDLAQYQKNLVRAGYLPPDTPTTGVWDSTWNAASKRFEQDNREKFYAGHHVGAVSLWSAVGALGWVVPSKVFQGIVGAAKGVVEQAPQTVERVGALGGAAGGAAIGASLGSVIPGAGTAAGAVIGAGIGAAVGFLGDLFGHADDPKQQSLLGNIADALTPFEEYSGKGGAGKFFQDLGLVASASGLILGAGAAAEGAAAGVSAITGGADAAGTDALSFALAKGDANQEVGWATRIANWAGKRLTGSDADTALMDFVKEHGLLSQTTRPLIGKLAIPAYTGLSEAAFGGRIASGISSIANGKETTLEQAMRTAPLPQSGIELPLLGDVVDLPAWVVNPTHFLPWNFGDMANGVRSALGDTSLKPVVEWVRGLEPNLSHEQAVARVNEVLGDSPAQRVSNLVSLHLNHGIELEAAKKLQQAGIPRWSEDFAGALELAKYHIRDQIIAEVGSRDVLKQAASAYKDVAAGTPNEPSVLQRVMSYAYNDPLDDTKGPASFQAYLTRLTTAGSGPDRAGAYFDASSVVRDQTERFYRGEVPLVGPDGKAVVPSKTSAAGLDRVVLKRQIDDLEREIVRRQDKTLFRETDPTISVGESARIREQQQQLEAMKDLYKALGKAKPRTETDYAIIAQRADSPTRESLHQAAAEYTKLREAVINTHLDETSGAHQIAKQNLEDFLLRNEDILPPRLVEKARGISSPSKNIADHLEKMARAAAPELKLDDAAMQRLTELGYKPVLAQANNLDFHVDPRITEIMGLGDYTRRANLFESLGLGLSKDSNQAIGMLRSAQMEAEVAQTAQELGLPLNSRRIMARLYRALKETNYAGVVDNATARSLSPLDKASTDAFQWGPWIVARDAKTGAIRSRWFAADLRELKVDDVYEALRDVPGFDFEKAQKIHGALMRGQAMGADLSFMHPIEAAHAIARNMRLNGLPGMTDVIRTWHTEIPGGVPKSMAGRVHQVDYQIPEDLAKSVERARWEKDFRAAAIKVGIDSPTERTMTMAMDAIAHGAMASHPELYPDADAFFRRLDVGYAEEYARTGDGLGELFRRSRQATFPTLKEDGTVREQHLKYLEGILNDHREDPLWYDESNRGIRAMFGDRVVPIAGKDVALDDLVSRVIAVTSGGQQPKPNFTIAMNAIQKFLEDPAHVFTRADKIMGRDDPEVLNRIFHEGYVPDTPKFGPFYRALRGDGSNVVMDRRMAGIFGYLERNAKDKWSVTWTEAEQNAAADVVRELAKRTGIEPATAQERLWMGFREFAADQAKAALKAGDATTADFYTRMGNVTDSANFAQILDDPKYASKAQGILDTLSRNWSEVAKRTEDEILGVTKFGPDYSASMRFFRSADPTTMTHEFGHLLRRVLAPEDIRTLEEEFALPRSQGPLGASQEIRDIAAEYHREYGVHQDTSLVDQYPDVNTERAKAIADAYENQKPTPRNPATKRAYKAFVNETMNQYEVLLRHGFKMEPWAGEGQPYANAAEFIRDVRENHHLYYFKTLQDDAFGAGKITAKQIRENPLLASSGHTVLDSAGKPYEQTYNDIFRAVHDIFAHAKEGVETGPRGEESAWRAHAAMYSPEARKAMTTETRGQNSWVNFGPHLRDANGNIPAKGEPGYIAPPDRPFAEQKVMLLPDEFTQLENGRWTPDAEERFANAVERYFNERAATPRTQGALESLRQSLGHLWSRYRGYADDKNLISPQVHDILDKWFGDIWKTAKPTAAPRGTMGLKPVVASTVAGAAFGAIEGDDKLHDTLQGAEYGLAAGLGARYLLRKSYGYLPDYLNRVAGALRYSLSPSFDVRRFTKQGLLAATKYDLPFFGNARRFITAKYGEGAWTDALKLLDEVHGARYFDTLDSFDRTLYQGGILGYSPLLRQAAHAYMLRERGQSVEEIRKALAELYQYGTGRTALEKSVNFVFFPFSFEKKLMTTVGDALLQAPARALLVHEGLRRYHQSKTSKEVDDFLTRHLPLLQQLGEFNAFSHGLSPGRFLFGQMMGTDKERTGVGEAAQLLANFFIPGGGAVSPIHRAVGGFGDLAVHAFTPIVVTGESVTKQGADLSNGRGFEQIRQLLADYIPFGKDLTQMYQAANDQVTALAEGESKYSQLGDYIDGLRSYKDSLAPVAQALGYASPDGLLQSQVGATAFKPAYDQEVYNLRAKYPTGFQMLSDFQDTSVIAKQALGDLMNKGSHRTPAEDAIVNIAQQENTWGQMASTGAMPSELTAQLAAQQVRDTALKWANDPRFVQLWNELYAYKYGPLKVVA